SQAERRHSAVHRFVFTSTNLIRLMPDTHVAPAVANALVKGDPRRPVLLVAAPGVVLELRERSPVLNDHAEAHRVPEETAVRLAMEFLEHPRHREKHRQPL